MTQNIMAVNIRERKNLLLKKCGSLELKNNLLSWLLILPGILLFTFYIWYPMFYGIVLSFFETEGFKMIKFAGFQNYIDLFSDYRFAKALTNSMSYVFWSLLLGYLAPILLAIVANEVVHFKGLIRTGLYFPNMVPLIAALLLWDFMMEPGEGGLFNAFLGIFGAKPFGWLQEPAWTKPLLIIMATWKNAGATALIYMASLQGISPELYEAASLDGAGIWQKLKYITIPGIFNMARLMLIMQIIFVFQILYEPLTTTGGGPVNESLSLMLLNYSYAFYDYRIGTAAASGVFVSGILVILSIIYFKMSKENEMS